MLSYFSRRSVVGLLGGLLLSASATPAMASVKGCTAFSAEAKGGYAMVNETVDNSHDNKGLMGGAAVDYYINCDSAAEFGIDYFPKVKYAGGDITNNDAIHLAAVGTSPPTSRMAATVRGKIGVAQTKSDIPSGLSVSQGERKELAWYVSFGIEGPMGHHVEWLVDASLVTKRKEVPAKYGFAAGLRFNAGA